MLNRRDFLRASALLALLPVACGGNDKNSGKGDTPSFGASAPTVAASVDGRMTLPREQRLMIREKNGQERLVLRTPPSTFPSFPQWSPDGSRIAFVQSSVFTGQPGADWGSDLYTVNPDGTDPKLVWKHDQPGAQVQGICWTPDGKELLIGYFLTIIKDNKFEGQQTRIERLEVAGGARTPLVKDALYPSLSKDGTKLAYLTQQLDGTGALFVSDAGGAAPVQLVDLGKEFLMIMGPRISPDGSTVAFSASHASGREQDTAPGAGLRAAKHGLPADIWKVAVADKTPVRLTRIAEDEPYPTWTPDGKTLIVLATGGLYEVAADGSATRKIGEGAFGGQVDVR